jgi:hypothetical protein
VWVAQAKAFDYLINKNKKSAQDAYKIILNVSKTANFPMGNIDAVRNIGDSVFTGALIYDWCLCNGDYSLSDSASRLMPFFMKRITNR